MLKRPRRLRQSKAIRQMVEEKGVGLNNLIYPLFVVDQNTAKEEISSMPGQYRYGREDLFKELESCIELGIQNFCFFPKVKEDLKNSMASYATSDANFYLEILTSVKKRFPQITIMTDVALDPYSSDGHDGVLKDGKIINDATLEILANMSYLQAQAGADIIGPSDMMDGRVKAIRNILEKNSYHDTLIMSYSAKYASAFYGPFRDALDSAPKAGDKKTYQMNPLNKREAIKEALLDEEEGADILMVKPALSYLDIIQSLKEKTNLPIAAYNVSGEYAMVKAASEKSWLEEEQIICEILNSIHRAGASIILSYHAKDFARLA